MKRPKTGSGNASTGGLRKKEKRKGSSNTNANDEEEDTATPEGKMMAQALSTFLPSEQTRFEAYRRSRFRADVVSRFVSSCLMDVSSRQYTQREKTRKYLGAAGYGVQHSQSSSMSASTSSSMRKILALGCDPIAMYHDRSRQNDDNDLTGGEDQVGKEPPNLKDLVTTGKEEEITLIVSTLAKMHAQKMVQSARALASVEGYQQDAKILPRHLLEAHRHRVREGVDPGFFMQSTVKSGCGINGSLGGGNAGVSRTASAAAALGVVDKYSLTLEVARAAQEAYEKSIGTPSADLNEKETSKLK